jgi:aerobic-type carbon monoxide dehydrogenase small subunit (CoxS/CutS family)
MEVTVNFMVNGEKKRIQTDGKRKLLDVLREDLLLTGTKFGCGEGECRACLVLIDGRPSMSCLLPITSVDNKSILTIEGLADGEQLHPVQQAFIDEEALQCGYCTSYMILSAVALLEKNPNSTEEEILSGMNRNICRCNGYTKILKAVRRAGANMREAR